MITDEQILARLLYKLLNNRCFRKGHMLIERVISGVPKSERGRAKSILKSAVRKSWIIIYGNTSHGVAYQLNIELLDAIVEFINTHYRHVAL